MSATPLPTDLAQAMVECLLDARTRDVDRIERAAERFGPRFVSAAEAHGIGGWAGSALVRSQGTPPSVRGPLIAARQRTLALHQRSMVDLSAVREAFDRARIPFIVLKGPALACLVHEDPSLKTYHDLDVLVQPRDFARAVQVLEDHAFHLLDLNWRLLRNAGIGELRLRSPSGGVIDLHWSPLPDRGSRRGFSVSTDDFFGAAGTQRVGRHSVLVLNPLANLLYVTLHASLSGGHRLVWLADIDASLRHVRAQDGVIAEEVRKWELGPAVSVMFRRLERTVLRRDRLRRETCRAIRQRTESDRVWRSLSSLTEVVSPFERAPSGGSLARLLARSCRADEHSSCQEFVRKARAWAWGGARTSGPPPAALLNDHTSPSSALYLGDDPKDEQAAYFDLVHRRAT